MSNNEEKPCSDCGKVHGKDDSIFPPEVYAVYKQYIEANDPNERARLVLELGELLVTCIAPEDTTIPDQIHDLVSESQMLSEKQLNVTMKLGRFAVKVFRASHNLARLRELLTPARQDSIVSDTIVDGLHDKKASN